MKTIVVILCVVVAVLCYHSYNQAEEISGLSRVVKSAGLLILEHDKSIRDNLIVNGNTLQLLTDQLRRLDKHFPTDTVSPMTRKWLDICDGKIELPQDSFLR